MGTNENEREGFVEGKKVEDKKLDYLNYSKSVSNHSNHTNHSGLLLLERRKGGGLLLLLAQSNSKLNREELSLAKMT